MKPRQGTVGLFSIIAVVALLVLSGCTDTVRDASVPDHWPSKLRMAYFVDDEHPGLRSEATAHLATYLEKHLKVPIEIFKTTEYGPMIEAMRGGKLDVNSFGTFAYLLAHEKAGAEAIITRGSDENGFSQYHSLIVVRSDSPLQSFEDLQENASKITYAFVNPASTSGHLVPRAHMEQKGLHPERDFEEVIYPRRQNATLRTIFAGKADAGSISINTYNKLVRLGRVSPDELRIIWKSPAIPSGCIAVREGLPQDLKMRIREILATVHVNDPEAWSKIKELYRYSSNESNLRYLPIDDSLFDEIRALARSIDNLDMLG
jgi:phosphonate transport system substrate-binding protein